MQQMETISEAPIEDVRAAYRRAAQQALRERDALASLRRALVAMSEDSMRLHQRSLALIEALSRDVERVRQQIKRMSTART
jgi:hypothetical protein